METNHAEALEQCISKATQKVRASKPSEICRYLPSQKGGYIHHFTFQKMKISAPSELIESINKHILEIEKPKVLPGRPRQPRGKSQSNGRFGFEKSDMRRLLKIANESGQMDLVKKIAQHSNVKDTKKRLITSIKQGLVEQELWEEYKLCQNAVEKKGE